MELSPIERNKAQSLLLKLVQVLTPWVDWERTEAISTVLTKRFFIFPYGADQSLKFRHPVSLLKNLRSAQELLTELTGKPLKDNQSTGETVSINSPFTQKEVLSSKDLEPKQKNEVYFPEFKAENTVSLQARQLIGQVRIAIQSLSTSSQMTAPQEDVLITALQKVKPFLDEVVKTVAENQRFDLGKGKMSHSINRPLRQARYGNLQKPLPLFEKGEGALLQKSFASESPHKLPQHRSPDSSETIELKGAVKDKSSQELENSPIDAKLDKIALPIAPCTPHLRSSFSVRKSKKKRKGFWEQEEDEEKKR